MVMKRKKVENKKDRSIRRDRKLRSFTEEKVNIFLFTNKIQNRYEALKFPYVVLEHRNYIPDFILKNGIVIEVKGYFSPQDRKKMLRIKQQYPDLDLRFIFGNKNNKINKKSKTTYSDWCDKNGFRYCDIKELSQIVEWYNEQTKTFPISLTDFFDGNRKRYKGWKPSKRPRGATPVPQCDIASLLGRNKADSK
jgi:hypothetical protein